MADHLTSQRRSENMRAIRAKNTRPELIVRRLAHSLGFRYRLHSSKLPGKPDLASFRRRKALFVNGCFWHGHDCKKGDRVPKSNTDYWSGKIAGNRERDTRNLAALERDGWQVLVVWECETKDQAALAARLRSFLGETTT